MATVALKRIAQPITELDGPADFNTLTTTGVWHQSNYTNARASTNGPSVNPGLLEVFTSATTTATRGSGRTGRASTTPRQPSNRATL